MADPSLPVVSVQPGDLCVGIDVAKEHLDVARSDAPPGHCLRLTNDPAGIARIVEMFTADRPACIVVESTGGLERPLLEVLLDARLPVARVNPGRVRYFAIGCGILAKTDRLDADVLAQFAQRAKVRLTQRCSANQDELDALVTCRRQLVSARAVQANCRSSSRSKAAVKSIDAVIKALDKQIDALDRQIRDLIDSDDDFTHTDQLLRTVPGIGPVASSTLMAELPELGRADRQCVGALVGVAPFNDDSGKRQGKRAVRGGRIQVRCVLYMATLTATRCNPALKRFAERLAAAGKTFKVIMVACMRKLLSWLNAMLRDNLTWDQLRITKTA